MEMSTPLDWVQEVATVASQACAAMGFATTVTVVDQRAQPGVQLMREGAFPQNVQIRSRKEITTASCRTATAVIEAETRMSHPWGLPSTKLACSLWRCTHPLPWTSDWCDWNCRRSGSRCRWQRPRRSPCRGRYRSNRRSPRVNRRSFQKVERPIAALRLRKKRPCAPAFGSVEAPEFAKHEARYEIFLPTIPVGHQQRLETGNARQLRS